MSADFDRAFGARIKALREARGWSQAELVSQAQRAGLAHFHQTTVSRLELGERSTRLDEAGHLAAIFSVPLSSLAEDDQRELRQAASQLAAVSAELTALQAKADVLDQERQRLQAVLDGGAR